VKRYLGLDFGDTTVGIAVSCPRGKIALGIETHRRADPAAMKPLLARLREIITQYGITHAILGNPLHMDGRPSPRSAVTQDFAQRLRRNFKRLTVTLWDERLSTQAVQRTLQHAAHVDEMAAVYILQGYLDSQNTPKEPTMDEQIILWDEAGNKQPFNVIAIEKDGDVTYLMAESASHNNNGDVDIVHFKNTATEGDEMVFEPIGDTHPDFARVMEIFAADYEELGIEII